DGCTVGACGSVAREPGPAGAGWGAAARRLKPAAPPPARRAAGQVVSRARGWAILCGGCGATRRVCGAGGGAQRQGGMSGNCDESRRGEPSAFLLYLIVFVGGVTSIGIEIAA